MDVPAIGAHCALSSCNVNDFLPIKCKCERLYCRDHISPEAHECPVAAASATPSDLLSSTKLERCAFETCKKPSLEAFLSASTREDAAGRSAALCEGCKRAFCAEHREPRSHVCMPLQGDGQKPEEKNAKARALLNKHFPASTPATASPGSSKTASEKITNPKKLAQIKQVQLMKMRHKAKPGDPHDKPTSVSVDQRLHLQVSKEGGTDVTPFWFRKTAVTGKAIDLLASHFGMSSSTKPLYLVKVSGDRDVVLSNSTPLVEQLEDGDSVRLSHENRRGQS